MKQNLIFHLPCHTHGWLRKTVKVIQLTVFLCIFASMNLLAFESYPQNAKLSLDLKSVTIEQVLQKIEQSSEFFFLYNSRLVDVTRKVDVSYKDEKILDILEDLFANDNVEYIVKERQIILSPKNYDQLFAQTTTGKSQGITITGKVTDADGNSLPGVNVVEKGTINGAVTDLDGNYTITVSGAEAALVFSFIGYLSEEMAVGSSTAINVTLIEDLLKLDEVVVVGYGTQKRSDVTGSLTSISLETLEERPVKDAIQAMQGKAAGVDVLSNNRPGEVARVRIRGNKSLTATDDQKEPLYIIDGIISLGNMNTINPNDIESMEILKDASATAIYGSRGANGVVLITTKKGSAGKVRINYSGSVSFDNIHSVADWASAGELLDRKRLTFQNGNVYRSLYPDPALDIQRFGNNDYWTINAIRQGYQWNDEGTYSSPVMRETTQVERDNGWPDQVPVYNSGNIPSYDWIDLLTQTGVTNDQTLSVSSGTEKSSLYFSVGYFDNKGTQLNQSYRRYTAKLNGDIKATDFIKVGTSLNVSKGEQQYGSIFRSGSATGPKDLYGIALSQYPLAQPYDTSGSLIDYPGNNAGAPLWNPMIDIPNTQDKRWGTNLQGNFYGEINFTPWLKYRLNVGVGLQNDTRGSWQGKGSTIRNVGAAGTPTASASIEKNDYYQWLVDNLIYFDKSFGVHSFNVTLLHSAFKWQREQINLSADGLINDSPKWNDLEANVNGNASDYGTNFWERQMESYMGRVNYSLMGRYIFTASVRNDGASVLASGNKWDIFPSFAFAWKMHEEGFLKSITHLSEMKLRLGYGVVGNSSVEPYVSTGPLRQYNYIFGSSVATGYIPGDMSNPLLGWEKTAQTNIGLDFGLFRNRLTGTLEYYNSNIYDLLMIRNIPAITGFTQVRDNIGKMKNYGIEITINSVNVSTKDFNWKTSFNFATNHEEIIELLNGKEDMLNQGLNGNGWLIGQPANIFRGYVVNELWQNTPQDSSEIAQWASKGSLYFTPGQYRPVDQNNNYMLEDSDKVVLGTPNPKWTGGMTNTFTYKNLSLSFFMYARIGQSYFANLHPGGTGSDGFIGYARSVPLSEFWSPETPNAKYPRPSITPENRNVLQSTYINNGSFVIVRNISLTYDLPKIILEKIKATNCQVYAQVLNPFIFGGEVVKAGINPDDANNWNNINSIGEPVGGTNNNSILVQSWVFGIRLGL